MRVGGQSSPSPSHFSQQQCTVGVLVIAEFATGADGAEIWTKISEDIRTAPRLCYNFGIYLLSASVYMFSTISLLHQFCYIYFTLQHANALRV